MRLRILLSCLIVVAMASCGPSRRAAELAEQRGEYLRSATLYAQLYKRTPAKRPEHRAYYAMRAAESYRALRQWPRALNFYRNSERYHYPDSVILLRLGQMTQMAGQYPEAEQYYKRYLRVDTLSHLARVGVEGCRLAQSDTSQHRAYSLGRAEGWSSSASDYAPAFSPDGSTLYIGSNRTRQGDRSEITGERDGNLYRVERDLHGRWGSRPDTIPGAVNTTADEATPSLSADGSVLYYTYAEQHEQYKRTAQIWRASKGGEGGWSQGSLVDLWRDSTIMAAHPSISPSGQTLFFVSDVAGGFGGKDLYRVRLEGEGYGAIEHLGLPINTPGDELFPHCQSDSLLYFASDGHPGYGGLDLYKAILLPSGTWQVEHLPRPLNSSADDLGIAFDPNLKTAPDEPALSARGYLSSSRDDGRGRPHLYYFSLPAIETIIEGYVMDREEYAISGATVRLVGNRGLDRELITTTRADGSYRLKAQGDVSYVMLASAPGYLNQYARFRTDPAERSEYYGVDFRLASRASTEMLEHVYYAFDRADLLPESQSSLDELLKILQDNPDVRLELSAHADRHGAAEYNQRLSERRATSVVHYLIERGIAPDRLKPVGYGQTQPMVVRARQAERYPFLKEGDRLTQDFVEALDEEQRKVCDALNRRTEFVVLDEGQQ